LSWPDRSDTNDGVKNWGALPAMKVLRNVGVIGFALSNEVGCDPWTNEEVRRRLKAKPISWTVRHSTLMA
jgi:hypothetical protein